MPDDNKIISGLWVCKKGAPLSDMQRLCMRSFIDHGHEFHLWIYDEPAFDKPNGLVLRDANEILPRERLYYQQGVPVSFSDWFRWELVRQKGGWYVDMDMICLRPLDFREELVWGKETDESHMPSALKIPRAHPLAEAMTTACANPQKTMPWDSRERRRMKRRRRIFHFRKNQFSIQKWGESGGPQGFTHAVRHFGMEEHAHPVHIFYPVFYSEVPLLMNDALHDVGMLDPILNHSYTIHMWNHIWGVVKNLKKNFSYTENSPYEILKRRHLPECARNKKH